MDWGWCRICYHLGRIMGRAGPGRIVVLGGLHRHPHGLIEQLRMSIHGDSRYGAWRGGRRIQYSRARGVRKHWRRECSKVGTHCSTRGLNGGWVVESRRARDWAVNSGWRQRRGSMRGHIRRGGNLLECTGYIVKGYFQGHCSTSWWRRFTIFGFDFLNSERQCSEVVSNTFQGVNSRHLFLVCSLGPDSLEMFWIRCPGG